MDLVKAENVNASFQGMTRLPIVRQVGLLAGLAASIAIGISIVLWSQTPDYKVLNNDLAAKDASTAASALQAKGIKHRIDPESGILMVESARLNEARLALAEVNLSSGNGLGFELMEKDQGFGTSSLVQTARYQRALEGELARTIMSIAAVEAARVHLALPKQSAFVRNQRKPSASVFVTLGAGRKLSEQQVRAVMHLVASSISNLETSEVTVVDSRGELLSGRETDDMMGMTTSQFEYNRRVEQAFIQRIEQIISPIVGVNSVRAQVVADMDFSRTEYTQESFNPDLPALRSEQSFREEMQGNAGSGGVPGALSNSPPPAGVAPENATGEGLAAETETSPTRKLQRTTKNFELDKTISHTRQSPGTIQRLSVAVVIDDKQTLNAQGKTTRVPYTEEEVARISKLVKDAVGFNPMRGDTVNITNVSFAVLPDITPPPELPLWEQPWVWSILKQLGGVILVLLVVFGVLRPVMRSLAAVRPEQTRKLAAPGADGLAEDQLSISGEESTPRLPGTGGYESNLEMAKTVAAQDPKAVAQVVKSWVGNEV